MTTSLYWPEMGEAEPKAQIKASPAHGGKHYFLYTPLDLKGRGVKFVKTFVAKDLSQHDQRMVGWHVYQVTNRAYDAIEERYSISQRCLLD